MKTAKWRSLALGAFGMLVLVAALSCRDSLTPAPGSAAAARTNGAVDASMALDPGTMEICGPVPATLVITQNARLVCDVECGSTTGPCIQFGRDNITLWLNGFTMRGPAVPPAVGCVPSPGFGPGNPGLHFDGISTAGFDRVRIRGPGMVETFRRHGIFVFESEGVIVERVTAHYNCYSGILLGLSNNNDILENVSVRNASASGGFPCGGNCITNSNGNRIWRNHFYGNGSVVPGFPPLAVPNDFGVGLVGTSSDNVIESNSVGGNISGIFLTPLTARNLIRRNLFAGNPPVQVSVTHGAPVGVDIRNLSITGTNVFEENHCITSEGPVAPDPCPNFPPFRGHY
ncbi:MAG: right-handed parallel beta-helix repeat-containing protein [Gemmatimonadota bacterium]|nr:right-handed parallel beta-helix repeat-containing protein [Gemmatimonadota bacterium]